LSAPIILVLDDYYAIQQPVIHQAMTFLVEHQPQGMFLVITTRQDPLLPLARWRARGQLGEIRMRELRFTEQEAAAFLNSTMRLHLVDEDVASLETRTEGWIVGLQLAAVSLQQSSQEGPQEAPSSFIQAFTGDDRYVMDYLIDEVLLRQPVEVQRFLLHTSILERFNAALCAELTVDSGKVTINSQQLTVEGGASSSNCQLLLDYLYRSNLFLIPLDNRREWYRYHHLFADLLRQRLKMEKGAGFVAELNHRAAQWYAEKGFIPEAVKHANQAQDYAWLADYLEKVAMSPSTWSRGEVNRLMHWLETLPPQEVETRPTLSVWVARACYLTGETAKAVLWLDKADAAIVSMSETEEKNTLLGMVAATRGGIAMMWEKITEMLAWDAEALRLIPESNIPWRSRVLYSVAYGKEQTGDLVEARRVYEQTLELARRTGNTFLSLNTSSSLAALLTRMGQLDQAERTCAKALELCHADGSGGSQYTPAASFILVPLGKVQLERYELEAAEKSFMDAVALAEQGGILLVISVDAWLPRLIWARLGLGKRAAALEALRKFDDFLVSPVISEHQLISYQAQRAHLSLALGETQAAIAWARRYEQVVPPEYIIEKPDIVLARVYLVEKRPTDALALLDRHLADSQQCSFVRSCIEIFVLRALALAQLNQSGPALDSLRQAVELAAPEGYLRLFAAEGTSLESLLAQMKKTLSDAREIEFVVRALEAIAPREAAPPPASSYAARQRTGSNQELIEPLSPRELEVLGLIGRGLSNAEIAQKLYLSLNTLKAHTQNIYSKLDVHSRVQVVNKARELGLIES
jgi:LuxR family maltose regulon positive regulatory protein